VLICPGFVPVAIPTEERTPERVCSTINLAEILEADSRAKETNNTTFMRAMKEEERSNTKIQNLF
jgi:hypothetical protein